MIPPRYRPLCEVCIRSMAWNGTTEGWGCPVPGGNPNCLSLLYRPKPDPLKPWPLAHRYPELAYGG